MADRKVALVESEEEEQVEQDTQSRKDETPPAGKEPAGFLRANAKWIVPVVVLVTLVGIYFLWSYYSVRESTDDAQVDGHINPISARVSGTAVKVLHDDNDLVTAGTPVVELDPKDYQVAVAKANADLANALAGSTEANVGVPLTTTTSSSQLAAADAGVKAAEKEVLEAQARVQEAQANYTKVSADLKRMEQLVQKDEISRQQYDASVAAAGSSRAALDAANAAVASAESRRVQARAQANSVDTVPEQIKMIRARAGAASAEVQKNQALLAQAGLNLDYTKIVAPVTGVLSKRSVEPGQVVQAGQPLFAIVDLDDIWITANFKENQLKNMKPGQPVTIHIDAYGRDYTGKVESIGGATGARFSLLPPENATGNYVKVVQRIPVRIRIDKGQDPNHLLRPGMSALPVVLVK